MAAITADKSSQTVKAVPVLRECCERGMLCRLHLLHSGQILEAKFHTVHSEGVVLRINGCPREDSLQPEAMVCVAFPFQQSLCAFLSCAKKVRDGDTSLEVHFDLPATLTATNLRRSFRVRVIHEAGVELTIRLSDGTRIDGEVLNVSESGIEINLATDDLRLSVDIEVQAELKFRGEHLEFAAIVRRRHQLRRALQFQLSHTPDARQQVAALTRFVRSLEQIWLKSRLV